MNAYVIVVIRHTRRCQLRGNFHCQSNKGFFRDNLDISQKYEIGRN